MEEYEAIKLARKIEWIIDKIHINVEWQIQDPLTQQEINDLCALKDDAETVVSWSICNNSQGALKIMGEHGILYLKLDEINHYYNFSEDTRLSIVICMRTLLRANHLLYDSPTGGTETIPKAGTDEAEADRKRPRTMKATTDVLYEILKKADINENTADKTVISNLISYLTGYSSEQIRQRLSNTEELTSSHKKEVDIVNGILNKLNTKISIKYNNNR